MRGGYRPNAGRPTGKRKTDTIMDMKAAAVSEKLTPLEYMLKIMRDPNEDKERRAHMAILAAPFCHVRKGESLGKK